MAPLKWCLVASPRYPFLNTLKPGFKSAAFKMSGTQAELNFHETLKPLSWLFGKWRSDKGKGIYPTMDDFMYAEVAEFKPIATKPVIEYRLGSWKPENLNERLHTETGFIKIKPDTNQVSFSASHHIGVVEIQVGDVHGQELTVETTDVLQDPFYGLPLVRKLRRTIKRTGNELEQVIFMETARTGMTEHLRITWTRDNETTPSSARL